MCMNAAEEIKIRQFTRLFERFEITMFLSSITCYITVIVIVWIVVNPTKAAAIVAIAVVLPIFVPLGLIFAPQKKRAGLQQFAEALARAHPTMDIRVQGRYFKPHIALQGLKIVFNYGAKGIPRHLDLAFPSHIRPKITIFEKTNGQKGWKIKLAQIHSSEANQLAEYLRVSLVYLFDLRCTIYHFWNRKGTVRVGVLIETLTIGELFWLIEVVKEMIGTIQENSGTGS